MRRSVGVPRADRVLSMTSSICISHCIAQRIELRTLPPCLRARKVAESNPDRQVEGGQTSACLANDLHSQVQVDHSTQSSCDPGKPV